MADLLTGQRLSLERFARAGNHGLAARQELAGQAKADAAIGSCNQPRGHDRHSASKRGGDAPAPDHSSARPEGASTPAPVWPVAQGTGSACLQKRLDIKKHHLVVIRLVGLAG